MKSIKREPKQFGPKEIISIALARIEAFYFLKIEAF